MTAAERHPLATMQGIATFIQLIEAETMWRRATKAQKQLLRETCAEVIRQVEAGEVTTAKDLDDRRPLLAYPLLSTRRSMQRKDLLDGQGRVTARALHATFWMTRVERGR